MNTSSRDDENQNLVMFPSSKNFKIDLSNSAIGHDPLYDLINEYSHIRDEEIPDHHDGRFERELEEDFHSIL
ncbi:MAG: hypothetical protein EHM20_03450, partial [Alphaproteobacteria bacterium]